MNAKLMNTGELKDDRWSTWKADLEDYIEDHVGGTKIAVRAAQTQTTAIDAAWYRDPARQPYEGWKDAFWRLLRKCTAGEGRKIVTGTPHDDGFV